MDNKVLEHGLQMVYDVLLDGTDSRPDWDRLIGLSAVGEALKRIKCKNALVLRSSTKFRKLADEYGGDNWK